MERQKGTPRIGIAFLSPSIAPLGRTLVSAWTIQSSLPYSCPAMQKRAVPQIISPSQRKLWHPTGTSIWTVNTNHSEREPALLFLRTLLDQPRWLETHYLYDEVGSELFEQICELPEYYLTRTEDSILAASAAQIIAQASVQCIVELGAGYSKKTLHLLREQVRQRQAGIFAPIDVSVTGLTVSRKIIRQQFPQLTFQGLHARYEDGISSIEKHLPTLFVFLGSTLGNFNRSQFIHFFHHLSLAMGPRDFLLLGVDRVKEAEILEKAYNDAQGVTAHFILNVFQNINRLFKSNFDPAGIRYHSSYNPEWQQIEMHAVSNRTQTIHFPTLAATFDWEKEERILVEISRKFEPVRLQNQLRCFGLKPVADFTDSNKWFSVLLFQRSEYGSA